jgi:hypothetical protein
MRLKAVDGESMYFTVTLRWYQKIDRSNGRKTGAIIFSSPFSFLLFDLGTEGTVRVKVVD